MPLGYPKYDVYTYIGYSSQDSPVDVFLQHTSLTRSIVGASKQQQQIFILSLGVLAKAAMAAGIAKLTTVGRFDGLSKNSLLGQGSSRGRNSLTVTGRSLLHHSMNLCKLSITGVQCVFVAYTNQTSTKEYKSSIFMHTIGLQLNPSVG